MSTCSYVELVGSIVAVPLPHRTHIWEKNRNADALSRHLCPLDTANNCSEQEAKELALHPGATKGLRVAQLAGTDIAPIP